MSTLKDIEWQVQIAKNLPLVKDIQENIINYIEESLPIYENWARSLYDNYMSTLEVDSNYSCTKKNIIDQVKEIFLKNYGHNIGTLIENIKTVRNKRELFLPTINVYVTRDIFRLLSTIKLPMCPQSNSPYIRDYKEYIRMAKDEEYFEPKNDLFVDLNIQIFHLSILFRKIMALWFPYQSQFFKYMCESVEWCGDFLDIYIFHISPHFENCSYRTMKRALALGLDPYEVDVIASKSFIAYLLNYGPISFEDEQRSDFESMMFSILDKMDLNEKMFGDDIEPELIIFDLLEGTDFEEDGHLSGWSPNFVYQILNKIDWTKLNTQDKKGLTSKLIKKNLYFDQFKIETTQNKFKDFFHIQGLINQ